MVSFYYKCPHVFLICALFAINYKINRVHTKNRSKCIVFIHIHYVNAPPTYPLSMHSHLWVFPSYLHRSLTDGPLLRFRTLNWKYHLVQGDWEWSVMWVVSVTEWVKVPAVSGVNCYLSLSGSIHTTYWMAQLVFLH